MEVYVHLVLTCVLGRGECSAMQPGRITLGQHFTNFGHGTLFNLVNIYETHVFYSPSFRKQMSAQ